MTVASPPALPTGIVDAFATHVARTRYEHLPPLAVAKAKTFLLDTIGVGLAGTSGPHFARISRAAEAWGRGEEATVWGSGLKLPAPSAAMVNAYLIHCLEYDCVHERAVVHPMATILSAFFAWAERSGGRGRPVDGRQLLTSLAVGVDMSGLLGSATTALIRFFRPAVAGGFGAVSAIGSAAGFTAAQMADAYGIQYGQCAGTLQPHAEGSGLLPLQIGFNARAAITSADLVEAGFDGPHDVLTGQYGYYNLFELGQYSPEVIPDELGRVWQIARLSHKPFPSGRLTHGALDGLRQVMAEGITAADIASVEIQAPPLVKRLVGRPDLDNPPANYAKLCLSFVAATLLLRGRVDVPEFAGDTVLNDPEIHAYARRISVVDDGNPDQNALAPQRVIVRLTSGRTRVIDLPEVYGHPEAPLTDAENRAKFARCCGWAVPPVPDARRAEIERMVDEIEDVTDVGQIAKLMVSDG